MAEIHHEALWRAFPRTLLEFEERFATRRRVARTLPRAVGMAGRAAIAATAIRSGRNVAARFTNAPNVGTRRA